MQEVSVLRLCLFFSQEPQYLIAKRLGINPCILSQYARGRRSVSSKHLYLLANYFDLTPEQLLEIVETDILEVALGRKQNAS